MAISTLIPGENYTFISLPLANAGFAQGRYIAYKYTGQVLGGISVSTGGFYTTNALTSGVISTGEVTSGLITTGQVVNPPVTTGISNTGCMNQCISDCGGGQVVSCVCNSQGGVVSVTCTSADSSGKILSASVAFMFFLILFWNKQWLTTPVWTSVPLPMDQGPANFSKTFVFFSNARHTIHCCAVHRKGSRGWSYET